MPKGEFLSQINLDRAEQLRSKQLGNYKIAKSGCWVWQGAVARDGYGKVKRFGKTLRAHRLFHEHHIGVVPEGLWVLHKCDTPLCVNPEHLFLGTQLDNEQDKDAKGRRPAPANTRYIEHAGVVKTVREWAVHLNISYVALKCRLKRGWSLHEALDAPDII